MAKKIKWQGKVNIEVVALLKEELIKALNEDNALVIDISGVEQIDTAGLQLLFALVKELKEQEGSLNFEGQVPKDVSRKLLMSGFTTQLITEGALLADSLMSFTD